MEAKNTVCERGKLVILQKELDYYGSPSYVLSYWKKKMLMFLMYFLLCS